MRNKYWTSRHYTATENIKENIKIMNKDIKDLSEYCDKLENTIKEVREYIEENTTSYYANTEETIEGYELVCDPEELLEILDKGE